MMIIALGCFFFFLVFLQHKQCISLLILHEALQPASGERNCFKNRDSQGTVDVPVTVPLVLENCTQSKTGQKF